MWSRSSGRNSSGSACPLASPCVTALRISSIFLGRLFGRLLQLSVVGGSRRRRLRGVRRERRHLRSERSPGSCTISSTQPAPRATMRRPIKAFAAARRHPGRCSASAALRSACAETSAVQGLPRFPRTRVLLEDAATARQICAAADKNPCKGCLDGPPDPLSEIPVDGAG